MDGRTVLLVDSDRDARLIVRRLLEHHGFRILEATEHDEALRTAREQPVGLIVTEMYIRRGAGEACLVESLKADDAIATIPVVVLTTQAFADTERRARAAGSARYIAKPFAALQFVREVVSLLP
jgi:chemosensory pili system protein ChpA (sensor histidine kinase/response regulator)